MRIGLGNLFLGARASLSRHQGFFGLSRRAVQVFWREGLKGIWSRLRFHAVLGREVKGVNQRFDEDIGVGILFHSKDKGGGFGMACDAPNHRQRVFSGINPGLRPGAVLVGHPYAVIGMGEVVRSAANALESVRVPFSIRNTFGDYGLQDAEKHREFRMMDRITSSGLYKANVFYLNADEMENALAYLGPGFFEGRYNIGCWAWELSRFPDEWCEAFRLVDEIWALSRFTQQSIAQKADCPVVWMPHPVELTDSGRMSRHDFGLPENKFLFLFFFDFRSYLSRKNPWAVIEAFQKAFGKKGAENASLVIKVNGTDSKPEEYVAFCKALEVVRDDVILIDKVMDDREIKELLRVCDCFVSLHRAEGFGRGIAEAMYLGKPVIATGYSGNLDFTNEMNACMVDHVLIPVKEGEYPYGKGQLWADPDIEQAAWYMERLVYEPSYAAEIGRNGERYIRTYHSFRAIGARMRHRLEKLKLI